MLNEQMYLGTVIGRKTNRRQSPAQVRIHEAELGFGIDLLVKIIRERAMPSLCKLVRCLLRHCNGANLDASGDGFVAAKIDDVQSELQYAFFKIAANVTLT